MSITIEHNTKERKRKPSILDPFIDDIRHYHQLGLSPTNISRLMNEKINYNLDVSTYWYFIKNKIKKSP